LSVVVKLRLFVAQVVQEHGMSHLVLDDGGGSPDAATRRYLEQLALERQRRGVGLGRDPRRAADEDCGVGRRGNQRNDASTGPARAVRVNTSDAARKLECALGQDWREEARLAKEAQEKARAANAASRAVREAALARESCSAWVGILVEQAMAESERRGGVAARLQASARGYAARQGLARMKKAVVSIQACRRGVVAKRVLAQMQGRRRDVAVWEERRAHERQEQRKRAEATREARLVAEAHSRATRAEAARRRREEAALAEELIMHACDNDVPLLLRALRSSEAAANAVNTPDEGGWTALMWAASLGHGRVCVLLLEAGADVHHADADGWGALLLAVDRNHYDAAEALLMSGADPSAMCWPNRRAREQKRNGRTALDIVRARQARGAGAAAAAGTPGVPGGELFLALLTRPPPPPPPAHPSGAEEAIEQVAGGEEGGGAEQSSAGHSQSQAVSAEQGGGQRRPATAPHTGRRTAMMPSRPQSAAAAQMSSTHMSTAARELRLALDSMHGVGMGAIGSAGFSTIMHARQLGVDTVLDAMMAYADHHGVQHFGIAQLVEWQQQQEEEEGEEEEEEEEEGRPRVSMRMRWIQRASLDLIVVALLSLAGRWMIVALTVLVSSLCHSMAVAVSMILAKNRLGAHNREQTASAYMLMPTAVYLTGHISARWSSRRAGQPRHWVGVAQRCGRYSMKHDEQRQQHAQALALVVALTPALRN
jgi:hypothetical protein